MRSLLLCLSLAAVGAFAMPSGADEKPPLEKEVKVVKVKGKIMKMDAQEHFVIRTADNRDLTLYVNPQTRFLIDGRPVKYGDLKLGNEIQAAYVVDGERFVVNNVWVGEIPDDGTVLEGRVVRVIGDDQVVIMGPDKKEVIVYVVPQTTYSFNNQPGKFVDLRPGSDIRVTYDLRDRRPVARGFIGIRRR